MMNAAALHFFVAPGSRCSARRGDYYSAWDRISHCDCFRWHSRAADSAGHCPALSVMLVSKGGIPAAALSCGSGPGTSLPVFRTRDLIDL